MAGCRTDRTRPRWWEARIPLHHLAPLAVHAIKFGGAYPVGLARGARGPGRLRRTLAKVGMARSLLPS